MATVENPRRWSKLVGFLKRLVSLREVSAWSLSFFVHAAVLVLLASLTLYFPLREKILLTLNPVVEVNDTPPPQEVHFSPDPHEQVGALSEGGVGNARPSAPHRIRAAANIVTDAARTQLRRSASTGTSKSTTSTKPFSQAPNLPENVVIKGSGSVGTTGAVGRRRPHHARNPPLARRAPHARRLALRPIRQPQTAARIVAKRFDRVYKELGVIEASGNAAFKAARRRAAPHLNRRVRQQSEAALRRSQSPNSAPSKPPSAASKTTRKTTASKTSSNPSATSPKSSATFASPPRAATS